MPSTPIKHPPVTIHDGCNALDVAYRIIEKLDITKENLTV